MLVRSALHRDARKLPLAREVENIIRRRSLANNGVWYDPSDLSTLFQDAAGTIPVTAAGQPVGLILDKSGRGNHATQSTAGYKPLYQVENGRGYLSFDGLDDFFVTGNIDFSSTDKIAVAVGARKLSDATAAIVCELSAAAAANNGAFFLSAPHGSGQPSFGVAYRGTTTSVRNATGFAAPISVVASSMAIISQDFVLVRINGADAGIASSDMGSGNFGNYPLYIGRRGGTSIPFNGRLYGLAICGGMDDIYKLKKIERYLAQKTGVII